MKIIKQLKPTVKKKSTLVYIKPKNFTYTFVISNDIFHSNKEKILLSLSSIAREEKKKHGLMTNLQEEKCFILFLYFFILQMCLYLKGGQRFQFNNIKCILTVAQILFCCSPHNRLKQTDGQHCGRQSDNLIEI